MFSNPTEFRKSQTPSYIFSRLVGKITPLGLWCPYQTVIIFPTGVVYRYRIRKRDSRLCLWSEIALFDLLLRLHKRLLRSFPTQWPLDLFQLKRAWFVHQNNKNVQKRRDGVLFHFKRVRFVHQNNKNIYFQVWVRRLGYTPYNKNPRKSSFRFFCLNLVWERLSRLVFFFCRFWYEFRKHVFRFYPFF